MPPKKTTSAIEDASISIAKLHRILRPLRGKCAALAEVLNQPSVRHAITGGGTNSARNMSKTGDDYNSNNMPYSSSPASRFHPSPDIARVAADEYGDPMSAAFGHLAYIPHRANASSGTALRNNPDNARFTSEIGMGIAYARLGDRIAAVTTAFTAVLKQIHAANNKPTTNQVPSLRNICGSIIGSQIEKDDVSEDEETGSASDSQSDDDDEDSAVDQWYEAIPEHLRR